MNFTQKLKNFLGTDDENNYLYLTAKEAKTLVNMREVKTFNVGFETHRYIEDGSNSYYPGYQSVNISRRQAGEYVEKFAETSQRDGKDLLMRVYISEQYEGKLYVSF